MINTRSRTNKKAIQVQANGGTKDNVMAVQQNHQSLSHQTTVGEEKRMQEEVVISCDCGTLDCDCGIQVDMDVDSKQPDLEFTEKNSKREELIQKLRFKTQQLNIDEKMRSAKYRNAIESMSPERALSYHYSAMPVSAQFQSNGQSEAKRSKTKLEMDINSRIENNWKKFEGYQEQINTKFASREEMDIKLSSEFETTDSGEYKVDGVYSSAHRRLKRQKRNKMRRERKAKENDKSVKDMEIHFSQVAAAADNSRQRLLYEEPNVASNDIWPDPDIRGLVVTKKVVGDLRDKLNEKYAVEKKRISTSSARSSTSELGDLTLSERIQVQEAERKLKEQELMIRTTEAASVINALEMSIEHELKLREETCNMSSIHNAVAVSKKTTAEDSHKVGGSSTNRGLINNSGADSNQTLDITQPYTKSSNNVIKWSKDEIAENRDSWGRTKNAKLTLGQIVEEQEKLRRINNPFINLKRVTQCKLVMNDGLRTMDRYPKSSQEFIQCVSKLAEKHKIRDIKCHELLTEDQFDSDGVEREIREKSHIFFGPVFGHYNSQMSIYSCKVEATHELTKFKRSLRFFVQLPQEENMGGS